MIQMWSSTRTIKSFK